MLFRSEIQCIKYQTVARKIVKNQSCFLRNVRRQVRREPRAILLVAFACHHERNRKHNGYSSHPSHVSKIDNLQGCSDSFIASRFQNLCENKSKHDNKTKSSIRMECDFSMVKTTSNQCHSNTQSLYASWAMGI